MTEKNKKALHLCINFGALISIGFILTSYIFFQKGTSILINPQLSNVNYMLCISGIFIAIRKLKTDILPIISYWQTFLTGLITISIAAIPFAIYSYFILSSNPDIIDNAILIMEKSLNASGYTAEQNTLFIGLYKSFATPAFMAFSQFLNKVLMGIFFSFVLASFLSTRKNLSKSNNSANFENKDQNKVQ